MKDVDMEREKKELLRKIAIKEKEKEENPPSPQSSKRLSSPNAGTSEWERDEKKAKVDATPISSKWDQTPSGPSSKWDATPASASGTFSKWDQTPASSSSKWDQTPKTSSSKWDQTPVSVASSASTRAPAGSMTPAEIKEARRIADVDKRNRWMSDEELNSLLPVKGYCNIPISC